MHTLIANKNKWYRTEDGATDIDFIRSNERLEKLGTRHCPMSSAMILEKFRNKAHSLGLELVNEQGALLKPEIDKTTGSLKGGNRFIYVAEVKSEIRPDYALSVGFRNFSDKTLSYNFIMANHIFVCENGCCNGIIKNAKMRHTIGNCSNDNMIDAKIDIGFNRFVEDKEHIHNQIGYMKSHRLTDDVVGKFVKKMNGEWVSDGNGGYKFVKNPYLGSANLLRIMEDLENPKWNDRNDTSVMRLLNSATAICTHEIKNPNQSIMASRMCNNVIMGLVKDDFVPLGDNDNDDVVEADFE